MNRDQQRQELIDHYYPRRLKGPLARAIRDLADLGISIIAVAGIITIVVFGPFLWWAILDWATSR